MTADPQNIKAPSTAVPIADILANRWSPRGFDTAAVITEAEVLALLEAARWTPSASNHQPWRFIVGIRGTEDFDRVYGCLGGGNLAWASRASALLVVVAQVLDSEGNPRLWAEYDAGQAAASISVQAESLGLSVHQMGGFDRQQVAERFGLDDALRPMAVMAIGTFDPQADLPEPFATREAAPRKRLALDDLVLNEWPSSTR